MFGGEGGRGGEVQGRGGGNYLKTKQPRSQVLYPSQIVPCGMKGLGKLRIGRMDDLSADPRFVDIHKQTALSACPPQIPLALSQGKRSRYLGFRVRSLNP